MSDAVDIRIAEAIKEELKAADLGTPGLVVDRNYASWKVELTTTDTPTIDVVPFKCSPIDLADRGTIKYEVVTDLFIRKRFGVSDQETETGKLKKASVDGMCLLREYVLEFFTPDRTHSGRRLATEQDAVWTEIDVVVSIDRKHLSGMSQFSAWVRVTYEIDKPHTEIVP
jgi:hypothetical protein